MKQVLLNGADCLMLAFDYQMNHCGFAGNLAQIVLGVPERISEPWFRERLYSVVRQYPIITAKLKRRPIRRTPYRHILKSSAAASPKVYTHPCNSGVRQSDRELLKRDILNTPLQTRKGEWLRFDLLDLPDGTMEIIMTWNHILMDAHGAEYFLYMLGNEKAEMPPTPIGGITDGPSNNWEKRIIETGMAEKWQKLTLAAEWLDDVALREPVSLYTRSAASPSNRMDYRSLSFSTDETKAVLTKMKEVCGVLNESAYYMAGTMLALQNLYRRKSVDTDSFVVSFPVSLRRIGTRFPVFTNQVGTILYEFRSHDLHGFKAAVDGFKRQTKRAVAEEFLFAHLCTMDLGRPFPSWYYAKKVKQALKGEIASLVFANPGKTFEGLNHFMGLPVSYQQHVPTVVVPPGIGVIFYTSSEKLNATFVWVEGLLSNSEVDTFTADIRQYLISGESVLEGYRSLR